MFSRIAEFAGKLTLLKSTAGNLSVKVSAALVAFANGILLARLLGAEQFGIYSILIAVINLAVSIVAIGLPTLATREAAALSTRERWSDLRGFMRLSHLWVAMAVVIFALAVAVAYVSGLLEPSVAVVVLAASVFVVAMGAFMQLRAGFIRGFDRVVLADIPEFIIKPVSMLIMLLVAFYLYKVLDAENAILLQAIASTLGLITAWFVLKKIMPSNVRTVTNKSSDVKWLRETIPLAGIGLITILENQMPLYLLGMLSNGYEAGIYQAAARLVGPISMGLVAVNMSLQPRVTAAWSKGDRIGAQVVITEGAQIGAVFAVISASVLSLFPGFFLGWFGYGFQNGTTALHVLVLGQVINAISGSCGLVLVMTGYQRSALIGLVLAAFANFIVGLVFIPHYGATGAAIGSVSGFVVWNVVMVLLAWRKTGLFTPSIRIHRS